MRRSVGEKAFEAQIAKLSGWEINYRFAPPRRWTFDFAWPARMLAVEVDGSSKGGAGGHGYTSAREDDNEKFNEATMRGWKVFHGSPAQAENGWLLEWVVKYLQMPRTNALLDILTLLKEARELMCHDEGDHQIVSWIERRRAFLAHFAPADDGKE